MRPIILLVDVASADRADWKSFLQNQSCEVFAAGDGDTALRQCPLLPPDLVILHDAPPEIDAFDLCPRLQENPLNPLFPVVLIKPSSDPADISPGPRAGACAVWGT